MKAACSSDLRKSVLFFVFADRTDRSIGGEVPARRSFRRLAGPRTAPAPDFCRSRGHPDALVRVYAARTVRWRGIFAGA